MSPEQSRAILGVAIFMCALIAADRLYDFYKKSQPLAEPGECLSMPYPKYGPLKMHVVKNEQGTTYAIVDVDNLVPGVRMEVPIKGTYEELRDAGVMKVSCE